MTVEPLIDKYTRLANTQPGVSRVGWQDRLQQALQFEILLDMNIPPHASVLDAGCGTGDLLATLDGQGFGGQYTGVDLMPPFIAEAQTRFAGRPNTQFITGQIVEVDLAPHNFVFASGLFDYQSQENNLQHWKSAVAHLAQLATSACAWNGYYRLPPERGDMWAVDLNQVVNLCRQLSPFWRLRADYAPGHFTAAIFQRNYWLTPAMQALIGHLFVDQTLVNRLHADPHYFARHYGVTMQQLNLLDGLLKDDGRSL